MEDFNKKIADKLSTYEYSQELTDEKVVGFFEKLDSQTADNTKVIPMHPTDANSLSFVWKIAASVVILLTASFATYRLSEVTVQVERGVSQTVQLPDGSQVQLNADSRLNYNQLTWIASRNVSLEGEAFFDVQKGEKFTVNSNLGSTQVMGTSFNIFARDDQYTVKCFTGKVGVSSYQANSELIKLTPGMGVRIQSDQPIRAFDFDKDASSDWRKGKYYFDNAPLKEVLATLSRQYNVEMEYEPQLGELRYTGYFDNRDLEKALKLICKPVGLTYVIRNDEVEIR